MQNAEAMIEELTRSSIEKAVEDLPKGENKIMQDIKSTVTGT